MKKILCAIAATSFIITTGCSCFEGQTPSSTTTTEYSSNEDDVTEANGNETETSTLLPEGMAYLFDDGSYMEIEKLLAPMNTLNAICSGLSDYTDLTLVYPEEITIKLAEYNSFESPEVYADFLNTAYVQMYGESFTLSNDYKSCSLLDEDTLANMSEFYKEYFFVDISPEYAFIVESEFCVTYKDEAGDKQLDCISDYYIAYNFNGYIYLDYFFVDTLDL